jgi:anion-transporting  ArsA/GET3 family ATPase
LTNILDELIRRRVLMILGKGGVGRSSAAAALAMFAAGRGLRSLLMETDPRRPTAASFGKFPGIEPVELSQNLFALYLGGQEALENYLGFVVPRPVLRAVLASSLYQYFVHAAPAVRELTMMGKIYHEIERRPKTEPQWDVIIVDAPASGQALNMIRMPFIAPESFGVGIVGREAETVAGFFHDRSKCALIAVTTAEPLAMAETLELHRGLDALGLAIAAVIFNRAASASFDSADVGRLMRQASREPSMKYLDALAEIARADIKRRERDKRALQIIRREIDAPIIRLKERSALNGIDLARDMATEIGVPAVQDPPHQSP